MSFNSEIKRHIKNLKSLSKYEDINSDKLLYLFNNLELDCDDSPPCDYRTFLDNAKPAASNRNRREGFFENKIGRRVKFALIPAAALLIIIVSVMINNNRAPFLNRAKAVSVFGDVKVIRGNKNILLKKDNYLFNGDIVYTGEKAFVEIAFGNSHLYRLSEKSRLGISAILKKEAVTTVSLSLSSGSILLNIKKIFSGDSVSIATPTSVAAVRGTVFGVKLNRDSSARYEVYEGKIKVGGRIPEGYDNIDEALKAKLKDYFEKNSIIVEKNSICNVESDNKIYSGLTKKNIHKRLEKIKLPVAFKASEKKFLLKEEMIAFLKNSKDSEKLRKLKLLPEGEKVEADNRIIKKKKLIRPSFSLRDLKKKAKYHYLSYAEKNKVLIFSYGNGIIEGLQAGNEKWIINIKERIASRPLIYKNMIYIAAENGKIFAVQLYSGKILWSRKISGKLTGRVRLILSDGYLYAATTKGILYKMSRSGRNIWKSDFGNFFEATPAAGKYMVVVSVNGGRVFGVDKRSGFKVIRFFVKSSVSSLVVNGKNIYAVTENGRVVCYNYDMDEFLWTYDIKADVRTDIIFDRNSLFLFTRAGKVVKVSGQGELLWTSEIGNRIIRNPVSDSRNLFIAADRAFYVIDKSKGEVRWSLVVPGMRSRNVAVGKNRVFFVSDKKGITILNK